MRGIVREPLQLLELVCPEANVAVLTSGMLEELDGFLRPRACLAKDMDGRTRLLLREKDFGLQFAKRNQSCAGHVGAGIFGRWRTSSRSWALPEPKDAASAAGERDLELISIIYICDDLIIW